MLLPVEVEGASRRAPAATLGLVGANMLVYLALAAQGAGDGGLGAAIWELPAETVKRWGLCPGSPSLLALIAAPWVHLNLLHLAGNLLFLWVFGAAVEASLGWGSLVVVYLLGGFAAVACQYAAAISGLAPTDMVYAGSSGAVIALLSTYSIRHYRARVRIWLGLVELSAPIWIVFVGVVLWYGVLPALHLAGQDSPSFWGHLGGAAAGVAAASLLRLGAHGAIDYSLEDAERWIAAGKLREGLRLLQQLQSRFPSDPRPPLALARAHCRIWDSTAAAASYGRAISVLLCSGELAHAAAVWQEAEGRRCGVAPATSLNLATALVTGGQAPAARPILEQVILTGEPPQAAAAQQRLSQLS